MGRILTISAAALLLALPACATAGKGAKTVGKVAVKGTLSAATVPLEDLNLKRDRIPDELKRVDTIYPDVPPDTCFMVDFEIRELDRVLGPDEDDVAPVSSLTFREKMSVRAEGMAIDSMRDLAADQIPFRDIVRRASGAKRHVRKRDAAYERGVARRTYLKGLGDAMGCSDARVKRELYADDEKKKRFLLF